MTDDLFARLRPSRFVETQNDGLERHQARLGNISPQGFLADDSVFTDTIRASAVVAEKISAGAITTDKLAANAVTAAKIEAGTITANEIASNAITTDKLNANAVTAAKIAADTITANEIAASAITATELAADSVTTTKILAANVVSSKIELTVSGKRFGVNDGAASAPGVFFDSDSDSGFTRTTFGALGSVPQIVQGGAVAAVFVGGTTVGIGGNANPTADNTYSVGTTSLRWTEVWAVDGTINTSDERLKRDIADVPLGLGFIRSLRPRVYRWKSTTDTQARESVAIDSKQLAAEVAPYEEQIRKVRAAQLAGTLSDEDGNAIVEQARATLREIRHRHQEPMRRAVQQKRPGRRLHYGFIAQEVKAALDAAGVDSRDAAFWKQSPDGTQSLSYTELIAPLLRAVQELADRDQELTERVEELERGRA